MSTIRAGAGQSFTTYLEGAPAGVTNWQLRVYNTTDAVVSGPALDDHTTLASGVTSTAVSPTEVLYAAELTAPVPTVGYVADADGDYVYLVAWMSSGVESEPDTLLVTLLVATYTTPGAVREELGVDSSVLTNSAATRLIVDAEDVIDSMLGSWWADENTGRKVTPADVEQWQAAKLDRATAKMATAIYRNPKLITGQQYNRIKGPDFEREGPTGAVIGSAIVTLLDDSGLRRLGGRATLGRRTLRPSHDKFLRTTRHFGA
jgi:predicted transcriptional regulator